MTPRHPLPEAARKGLRRPLFLTRAGMAAERIARAFWPLWTISIATLSVLMLGSTRRGSSRGRLLLITTSGAMKSGVPTTSGGNRAGTTRPSTSMMQTRPLVGASSTFL